MDTIRPLRASQRAEILGHLLGLSSEDRRLRFGTPLCDAAIAQYVGRLDFGKDRVFGIFEDDQALKGVAHVALDLRSAAAELGFSVAPGSRCKGYGYALFFHSALQAQRLGCRKLYLDCLTENRVMMHLARKAGMTVVLRQGEAEAYLVLGGDEEVLPARQIRRQPAAGRAWRGVLAAAFLPLFAANMALLAGAGAACQSCKPVPVKISQCAPEQPGCSPRR